MPMDQRGAALKRSISVAVVTALVTVGLPAGSASASRPAWPSYVLGPSSAEVGPVKVEPRGDVRLGRGRVTTLTTVAGRTPASVLLDFGKDVAGTPFVDVTAV